MKFIVITNFSEAVDPEERRLRLRKVAQVAKRAATAARMAHDYGLRPGLSKQAKYAARLRGTALHWKSKFGQAMIQRFRPGGSRPLGYKMSRRIRRSWGKKVQALP